jgi:hypothetical protein
MRRPSPSLQETTGKIGRSITAALEHLNDERIDMKTATVQCAHPEWTHEYDDDSILGDSYWCVDCGELMQVG